MQAADVEVVDVRGDEAVIRVDDELRQTPLGLLRAAARQEDRELAAVYAALVRRADEIVRDRWARAARAAVSACSGHAPQHTTEPVCYRGSVSRSENRAAHGWVTYREVCRCGAERAVNQNQSHFERGDWAVPVEA